jgi:hypothetical protein
MRWVKNTRRSHWYKYLTVRFYVPVNLAGIIVVYAIKRNGLCIGLDNIKSGRAAKIKSLPINYGTLTGLIHRHAGGLRIGGFSDDC